MPKKHDSSDHMELGDTGIIPMEDGWFKNTRTNQTMDPDGCVYDEHGNIIYDPDGNTHSQRSSSKPNAGDITE